VTNLAILEAYLLARNGHRSAKRAAEGFISGKRIYNLRAAQKREQEALYVLADWTEEVIRHLLGLDPMPKE
jgi:hypothetical protein